MISGALRRAVYLWRYLWSALATRQPLGKAIFMPWYRVGRQEMCRYTGNQMLWYACFLLSLLSTLWNDIGLSMEISCTHRTSGKTYVPPDKLFCHFLCCADDCSFKSLAVSFGVRNSRSTIVDVFGPQYPAYTACIPKKGALTTGELLGQLVFDFE